MNTEWTRAIRTATLVLPLLAVGPACRKSAELPAVEGAKVVVPFSAVVFFREMPVSSREFDAADRRWKSSSAPRFDGGRLRSRPAPDGGEILVELPPAMAFRNRGADCGSSDDRRICALPWERAEITLCGRPFDGHLELATERLRDAGLFVCRIVEPAHEETDGGWVYAERDCSRAPRLKLAVIDPADLQIRVGDIALVADPGGTPDKSVCAKVEQALRPPAP
jgi:hypothetical protein